MKIHMQVTEDDMTVRHREVAEQPVSEPCCRRGCANPRLDDSRFPDEQHCHRHSRCDVTKCWDYREPLSGLCSSHKQRWGEVKARAYSQFLGA